MLKFKAKIISNILKLLIVVYMLFMYYYQSKIYNKPLSSDEAKAIFYLSIGAMVILFPIDASIFIKNWKEATKVAKDVKEEVNKEW